MRNWLDLLARAALAQIFLIAGTQKMLDYAGTQGYMHSAHVPGALLPLVIALELGGGLGLLLGWHARLAAALLAAFSVVAAALFHANFGDEVQTLLFLKDVAIAGGLLMVAVHGIAAIGLDARASGRQLRTQ